MLNGGAGDDRLRGGPGRDTLDGDAGIDTVEEHAKRNLVVRNRNGALSLSGLGVDNLIEIERLHLIGNEKKNKLDAAEFSGDEIQGVDLDGGLGNDILIGSPQDDLIIGGPDIAEIDSDTIDCGDGFDRVLATPGQDQFENCENRGAENIAIDHVFVLAGIPYTGSAADEIIIGTDGPDIIDGGGSNDTLRLLGDQSRSLSFVVTDGDTLEGVLTQLINGDLIE